MTAQGEPAIRAALQAAEEFVLNAEAKQVIEEINKEFALVVSGGAPTILHEKVRADGRSVLSFWRLEAFRTWFGNKVIMVENQKGEKRSISWARLWLTARDRRQYHSLTFAPKVEEPGAYNLWQGFDVEPAPGDYPKFAEHLYQNVCGGDPRLYNWLFGWFAQIVQRPAERIGTALVLRGQQGVGKTKVGEVFGSLFSRHYCLADDPRYITGQFNAHMISCLLLQVDEGFWAGDKQAEGRLKGLITSSQQFIERKGVDPVQMLNLVRLLVTSNHDWVVPAGFEERRFAVLDVAETRKQDHEFFAAIDREMDEGGRAALLYDLLRFDLDKVNLRQVPNTQALFEQKIDSLPPEGVWWFERLAKGTLSDFHDEWRQQVPKAKVTNSYIKAMEHLGVRRRSAETALGMALKKRLCPGIKTKKITLDCSGENGETVSKRVGCYIFPPLEECRQAFAELIGWPIPWDEL